MNTTLKKNKHDMSSKKTRWSDNYLVGCIQPKRYSSNQHKI